MKEERFVTAKEEKTRTAKYVLWFAIAWIIICIISALLEFDGLKEDISERMVLLVLGAGGLLLVLAFGAFFWFQGKAAQRERKKIMENGRVVTGIVTGVDSELTGRRNGAKFTNYYVNVTYQTAGNVEKHWKSPVYSVNPYDYVGLQKECKLYVWGEKCCLAEVQKRKQPAVDELMEKYAFLIPKDGQEGAVKEKHCVFIKGKKDDEIISYAKVKDLDIRYRLESFKDLDEAALDVAKDEWSQTSTLRTDGFLRFITEILRQAKPIGHFEVFLEVRFISKRICDFSTRYAIEQDFDALIKELNFQYTEKDYEFLKSHIQSRMEESAKKHFGRIPVTEVVVELL